MSTATAGRAREPIDRFAPKVDFDAPGGCWLWIGYVRPDGYGSFMDVNQRTVMPHRWLYLHAVGPIPDGLHLDHLCRNRACVNPDHLEPVTPSENALRGDGPSVWRMRQIGAPTGTCAGGHRWTPENTYYRPRDGFRECRTCRRERSSKRDWSSERARRRGSAA